ncbi:DUF6308 family protein [Kineococcus endophyticus]|uniref:DUF6308 family protein n=1 Tax=Kineococcus endophyticus TaxID=1181883 RepID=A0ABV3P3N1_9ACTN
MRLVACVNDLVGALSLRARCDWRARWDRVAHHLAQVPREVAITDADAAVHLGEDRPLWRAWDLLVAQRGIEWVTAAKLLARKRPALVPVYDRVVRCAFSHPPRLWAWLVGHFADAESDLAGRLARARSEAGVDDRVSVLRVLDVVVWMRPTPDTTPGAAPAWRPSRADVRHRRPGALTMQG